MEFKGLWRWRLCINAHLVDIGTEWNLKMLKQEKKTNGRRVDIGTEWNLKQ